MAQATIDRLQREADRQPAGRRVSTLLARAAALVDAPLHDIRQQVAEIVAQQPEPAAAAAGHLVQAGGKAVRPLLTLLAALAVGGEAARAVPCAVAAELVHDATLLHDDVIDDGVQRRGRAAPRVLWGNTVSVLSGDLLFVLALRTAGQQDCARVLPELIDTVARMVEGEVIQFEHRGRLDLDLPTYFDIAERKTASLFRWCARAGAAAAGAAETQLQALGRYGHHVGMAFQIRDDVLDLTAEQERLGKQLAADLAQGKITLPVVVALEKRPELVSTLRGLSRGGAHRSAALAGIVAAIAEAGGFAAAHRHIVEQRRHALEALASLPANPAVQALAAVAEFLGERDG